MPATFLTANDLRTGEIVFWTDRGVWSAQADQALLALNEDQEAALTQVLEDPKIDLEVVGAYTVAAGAEADARLSPQFPKKLRESRRLSGPGVDLLPPQGAA